MGHGLQQRDPCELGGRAMWHGCIRREEEEVPWVLHPTGLEGQQAGPQPHLSSPPPTGVPWGTGYSCPATADAPSEC
eukprot:CAMPEP_0174304704 /NCGR_PEP_ID=MMETSP0809-20121228/60944_1 /TAXON_ID=73025 ORGANISM="Eutreptiella gymnastica-like, Strain CCMP1594" /NCGR_SAMPLE_ID=MMETSP0809 /ASSEMBLY_ACC=CAM_ASM_000658 /LENGTH=76 /DNA_ID=CAMNT_0015410985 /DNA_START=432 /DNA_END=663 /DNA_ORIENTATION=+